MEQDPQTRPEGERPLERAAGSEAIGKYVRKFSRLRQGVTKYGPAPHKPVLLLAVLRGMGEGWICENRIELSPELAGAFKSI